MDLVGKPKGSGVFVANTLFLVCCLLFFCWVFGLMVRWKGLPFFWGGFLFVLLLQCGEGYGNECRNYGSDYTSEATCGDQTACATVFQGCRCESSGCENHRFSPGVLRFFVDSWEDGKPRIQVMKNPYPGSGSATDGKVEDARPLTETTTTSYCLSLSIKDGVYDYALREYTTSCSSEVFYSGSLKVERMWSVQSLQVSVGSASSGVARFEDFSDSENGCVLGDIDLPPFSADRHYKMVGPFDCGTNFEAIKLKFEPGATFSLSIEVDKTQSCELSLCESDSPGIIENLLEPRVSCVQPCIGDTCFFELGYTNRFPTDLITDPISNSQSTDMGYKYHPSYSTEGGIVNIMYPSNCADLQTNPKFLNSNGDFVRFDTDSNVAPCNSSNEEHCSLSNYINSYSKSPKSFWEEDPYQDLAIMQHWREAFGWDYEKEKKIDGLTGYAGFRMQPMFFAPGRHESVSIVPVPKYTLKNGAKEKTEWCWVLGVNFLDICTDLECRKSYDSISCPRSPGMHAVYTYFYTTLRINQKPGFNNFHRLSHLDHESGFDLDNAYRFTFTYQFEEVVETGTDELRHAVFPLPSPCMQDEFRLVFFLETYDAQCGIHVKPPCPGGYCNPIISRMTESSPLRAPFQLPGSGCNSNGECRLDGRGGPVVGEEGCQCAGGWNDVGSCADHTCLALTDFGATTLWTQCAAPSGSDPMLPEDRDNFLALRGDPLCTCDGITECPQGEMLSSGESWCADGAFSPYCTPSSSLSGNSQKSLWKMDICHSGNPECGPTLPQSDGYRGCTSDWHENRCKFKEFSFQYGCAGVGDEKYTCKFIDTRSVETLRTANDIREVLVPGVDFLSWKRGDAGDNPAMDNTYDPDADGIVGVTTEWFCFDEPDAPIKTYEDCSDIPHCGVSDLEPFPLAGSCGCCGNGICEVAQGEDCNNCPYDCMSGPEEGGSHFCCGEVHFFEEEVGACANTLCNTNSVGSTCSEVDSCEGEVVCPDCRGARVPLSIKLEFQDGTPITDGCEYFPLAQPICKFEEELSCQACGPGENQGCPSGKFCDLELCQCSDECEAFSCDSKSARDCGIGKKKCEGAECTSSPALNCRELGASACCLDCENTYSKALRDVVTTVCDDTFAPCCPEGTYPEEPNRCDCITCEEDFENDASLCGRDDPSAIFLDVPGRNNLKKVDLQRFNPFGCECVSCDYHNIECPQGYVLYPPKYIQDESEERAKVEKWLSTASVFDCPTCVRCDELAESASLFGNDHSLCAHPPKGSNSCACTSCNWADLQCSVSAMFPAHPTRSQLEVWKSEAKNFLSCFDSDPYCDASVGFARSSPFCDFECVPCACPYGTYLDPKEKSACNFSSCLPCQGVQSCGVGEALIDGDGFRVDDVAACSNPCSNCQCQPCTDDDFVCLTDDGKMPNQFDWVIRTDACNLMSCLSCKEVLDCPSMGMAYDTSSTNECECRPCDNDIYSDADLECSGVDQGVHREVVSSKTSCECVEKSAVKECTPRCGTKIAADGLTCEECPETLSVTECQKGWVSETCPPYHQIFSSLSDDELKANDCSSCLPCRHMCTQDRIAKVGQCDWVVANEDCTFTTKRESCPPGKVVKRFDGSGLPDYPEGACPVCVDPKESCPCSNLAPIVADHEYIIYVLEDSCQECVPVSIPLHVVNQTFISAEPSPDCDGSVIVKREPCPDSCPTGQERLNPKDKCSCAPCANKECPEGERVDPKNPCQCVPCKCSDCMSGLRQEAEGLCISVDGVTRCWGCTDASGNALPEDGVCEKFFHCDTSDLCSPKLVECPACPKVGEAPFTPGWPSTKWVSPSLEDYDIKRLTCQDGLNNEDYCDPAHFCAETSCSCPEDCKPYFDAEANVWHACDSSALCLGPKSCEDLGWAKCSGYIERDGDLFELFPKTESNLDEEGCSLSICDCESVLLTAPANILQAKRDFIISHLHTKSALLMKISCCPNIFLLLFGFTTPKNTIFADILLAQF